MNSEVWCHLLHCVSCVCIVTLHEPLDHAITPILFLYTEFSIFTINIDIILTHRKCISH